MIARKIYHLTRFIKSCDDLPYLIVCVVTQNFKTQDGVKKSGSDGKNFERK